LQLFTGIYKPWLISALWSLLWRRD